jgi:hypothetical protein
MADIAPEQLADYFRIADELRGAALPGGHTTDDRAHCDGLTCHNCGSEYLVTSYAEGDYVCAACAFVQPVAVHEYALQCFRPGSNYKRIHHWHERVSQLQLLESAISDKEFDTIEKAIFATGVERIDKTLIRSVLRPLKLQKYIEKWLQIMWRITGERPPQLSDEECCQMDGLFIAIQVPFQHFKPLWRKNFLNYNYTFHRLLIAIGRDDMRKYFPLIKSKSKLTVLDETWAEICRFHRWTPRVLPPCEQWTVLMPKEPSYR